MGRDRQEHGCEIRQMEPGDVESIGPTNFIPQTTADQSTEVCAGSSISRVHPTLPDHCSFNAASGDRFRHRPGSFTSTPSESFTAG